MTRTRLPPPLVYVALIAALSTAACLQGGEGARVDLEATSTAGIVTGNPSASGNTLVLAVAAVNSPRSTFSAYADLAEYLAVSLEMEPRFIGNRTYAEINGLVRFQEATLAIVCSAPYVYGNAEFGMELVVSPIVRGQSTYHSNLIVRQDSTISSWAELRGRTFAFTDPLSNSGRLVPTYRLSRMGETPESFFSRYIFTYSHENSIRAVAEGLVDAAAVDSLVYDYALANEEDGAAQTKVIWQSAPYPINPVVVNPRLDPILKDQLRELLLGMHETAAGRAILDRLTFDRFVTAEDAAYDPIRDMIQALAE